MKILAEATRRDNASFFENLDQVPMHCSTQGVGTLLRVKHLVLLASGEGKSEAVSEAVEGPLISSCPSSAIQLHPHVTVILDQAVSSRLQHSDYH